MRYGELRWPDVGRLVDRPLVAVLPLGSLEQHGHHLPLLTDTLLVTGVAERVEARLGERMLLLPTLWLGASDHHLDFPGTVSVPNTVYVSMIQAAVRSLVAAGLTRILLLNGHGGNAAPGETAITELANTCERCDASLVALASYWTLAAESMAPQRHGMDSPQLTHACEYETSMMLDLHRQLVVMEAARGHDDRLPELPQGVRLAGRFHRRTASGALGRPERATAEKGRSLIEAIADDVAQLVQELAERPLPTQLGPAT